jgi:hypothetical protein
MVIAVGTRNLGTFVRCFSFCQIRAEVNTGLRNRFTPLTAFPIREDMNVTFRWEVFNAFNRTNLANPNGAVDAGAGSAGVITSLFSPMRQMSCLSQRPVCTHLLNRGTRCGV